MARYDIMPHESPHSGIFRTDRQFHTTGETYEVGEPVGIASTGLLLECATLPHNDIILGIAGAGPGHGTRLCPETGTTTWPSRTKIPVVIPEPGARFRCSNWSANGTTMGVAVPAIADIGTAIGLAFITPSWAVAGGSTTGADLIGLVTDVLYGPLRRSIAEDNITLAVGDEFYVIFEITAHQRMPDTGVSVDAATV